MKKIVSIIVFLSCFFSVYAQPPAPSGLPAPYSTGYYRIGWIQSDSGFIYAPRDTTIRSRYPGLVLFWGHAGVDSSAWLWNGRKYVKELNSQDTLPGRILVTPYFLSTQGFMKNITGFIQQGTNVIITGSGTLLSPYVINSSGGLSNAVDSIWRTPGKDSIQFTIAGRYHSIYDSAGGSGGGGTVTTVGFTASNGFTGIFANPSTTPNLTIGTSVTGLLFGNGTAISNATVSTPLTYSTGALGIQIASGSQAGAVSSTDWTTFNGKINLTSLSATSPLLYNNTTGVFTIQVANTSQNGYLSSTDWNAFNIKQSAGNYITALTTDVIASGPGSAVATIQPNVVSYSKIQAAAGQGLMGATGAGNFGLITLGTNLSMTGSVLNATTAGAQNLTYTQNALNNNLAISGGNNVNFLIATHSLAGLMDSASKAVADSLRLRTYTWPVFNIFAANGLTAAAGDSFYLGGALNQNTTIATAGFIYSVTGLPSKATALATDSVIIENALGQQFKLPVPSGGSGLTGGSGLSPLFTNGVSGSTLTFTASNAAANTAFGNFTGSSAAAAFGKLPLAAMATGTANSLIGYDGSGNPSVITLGTNLSISGTTLNAAGGASQTFPQVLAAGRTFSANDSVLLANNQLYFKGGTLVSDSLRLTNAGYSVFLNKYLYAYGTSITAGNNASPVGDSCYICILKTTLGDSLLNRGQSGQGAWLNAKNHYADFTPNTYGITTLELGSNDLVNAPANISLTYNKEVNVIKDVFVDHNMNAYTAGFSASKFGTWTSVNAVTVGGKTTTAAQTTTLNDSVVFSFTGTSICPAFIGGDSTNFTAATVQIFIDQISQGLFNLNYVTDGVAVGSNTDIKLSCVKIFTGLSAGSHSIKIVNTTGSKTLIVDYFATLAAPTAKLPMIVLESSKRSTGGNLWDSLQVRIDSVIATLPAGYSVYDVHTNNYFVIATGLSGDNIHPNNTGHRQIFNGIMATIGVSTGPKDGTIIYSIGDLWLMDSARYKRVALSQNVYNRTDTNFRFPGNVSVYTNKAYQINDTTVLFSNSSAFNTGVGFLAGTSITSGLNDMFLGYQAGNTDTSGSNNVAVGFRALRLNLSGNNNVAVGSQSLIANTTGSDNVGVGNVALDHNTSGAQNTAIGSNALFANTTGGSNIGIGQGSLSLNLSGSSNIGIGSSALSKSTASENLGVGINAASNTTSGTFNVAIGNFTLQNNVTGGNNVAVGRGALSGGSNTSVNFNTGVGYAALGIVQGNGNTGLGYNAGSAITTGTFNIIIGQSVDAPSATASGQLNIGNVLYGLNMYSTTGNSSTPTTTGSIGIGLTTPTARLHLPAGTATASSGPIKFTTGVLTTTPEIGLVNFVNGLWYGDSSNSVRDTFAMRRWVEQNFAPVGGVITNIYNSDGTLTANRFMSGAGFTLALGTSGSNLGGLSITGGKYNSTQGSQLLGAASTINNAVTSASGNVTNFSGYAFLAPTLTSTNTGVTYASPATLYIDGPPVASTNSTITGINYSLNVNSGIVHFGGSGGISGIFDGSLSVKGGTVSNAYNLSIGASTTANHAVHFDTGVDPTTTVQGGMWWNGTNLYFGDAATNKRDLLNGIHNYVHTIFTPTTGGTVSLVANNYNIINPAGALLALTVNLPSSPVNNDVVYIKFTQNVTTVTYGNGTVVDGITAPTAGGLTVLTFDAGTSSWY